MARIRFVERTVELRVHCVCRFIGRAWHTQDAGPFRSVTGAGFPRGRPDRAMRAGGSRIRSAIRRNQAEFGPCPRFADGERWYPGDGVSTRLLTRADADPVSAFLLGCFDGKPGIPADLRLDRLADLGIVAEERPGVLPALPDPLAAMAEP